MWLWVTESQWIRHLWYPELFLGYYSAVWGTHYSKVSECLCLQNVLPSKVGLSLSLTSNIISLQPRHLTHRTVIFQKKSSERSLAWSPLQPDSQRHSEMGSRWCRTVGWFILGASGGRQNKSQHVSDRRGHRWHPCPQPSLMCSLDVISQRLPVVVWVRKSPISSRIWTLRPQLVDHLGRFRR